MKMSKAGQHGLSILEKTSNKSYQDDLKLWTVGIGHLIRGDNDPCLLKVGVGPNYDIENINLTNDQMYQLLAIDLEERERQLNSLLKRELNQTQFDAVFDFFFNMGIDTFKNGSRNRAPLMQVLNDESSTNEEIIESFYDYSTLKGEFCVGRLKRRFIEVAMFINPEIPDNPSELTGKYLIDGINIIKKYKSMI